jgi:MOSC domain-containing protein YiiM
VSGAIYRVDAVLTGIVAPPGGKGKLSAIGNLPVDGRVWPGETGLEADQQAERKHHGEPEMALHHAALEDKANLETLTPSWRAIASKRLASGKVESWASRLNTPSGQTSSKKQVA